MEHFGKKLKLLRSEKLVSQEEMARRMKRSQNAISSIERNQYPTIENIILYLDALDNPQVLTGTDKHAEVDEFRTVCADILLQWAA